MTDLPNVARVRTPTVIQMEAVECGAAALGIMLEYYGCHVPLEELRIACDVSRDGCNARMIVEAGQQYGLNIVGKRFKPEHFATHKAPFILYWGFNHFVVFEGCRGNTIYLNDPASGPYTIDQEEFRRKFTGVVLLCEPGEFLDKRTRPNIFKTLAMRLQGYRNPIAFILLAEFALVLPGLITPFFAKVFVDDILVRGYSSWITPLLLGMAVAAFLQAGIGWLRARMLTQLNFSMALAESGKFLWHLLHLPISFFQQRMAGDISYRVSLNDRLAGALTGQLTGAILDFLTIVFYLILMFSMDLQMTLLCLLISILNLGFLRMVSRKRVDETIRENQEAGKLTGTAINGLSLIETLKASGGEAAFLSRWMGYHAKLISSGQRLGSLNYKYMEIPGLLSSFNGALILFLGGIRILNGDMTIGTLVAFQSLIGSFLGPVNSLMSMGSELQMLRSDLDRLDDVLAYEKEKQGLETSDPNTIGQLLNGEVHIKDLTFGYSQRKAPLIKNFNLLIKPGQRIALTGKSGSGKSTIARLVAGLYQPWEGEILFDGKPRIEIPKKVLAHSMALVDQDISLFGCSVRDNLTLWNSEIPEQEMIRAAIDAHIYDEINARPNAYDSMVFEGGANFSGGQQQRLEIARALTGMPNILIMDEATSALDPNTEHFIDEKLRARGCTCLIVAHRLSTIRDCDEIIVLEKGEVVQRGSHDQMIAEGGPYLQLIGEMPS